MTVQLNVPAIEPNPSMPAEARIAYIQYLLDALPRNSPDVCARQLVGELVLLNRQEFPVATRLAALELYRQAILELDRDLSSHYCDRPLPLEQAALQHAELSRQLFAELAIGFEQAIVSLERKRFSLSRDSQLALLMQRAADALGRQLRVSHLTHASADTGVWAELHALYRIARQKSLQDRKVPDASETGSVSHSYKHALLLALANPSLLPAKSVSAIANYLDQYCDLARLSPLLIPASTDGMFLVNFSVDAPAQSLRRYVGPDAPDDGLLLVTHELLQRVHQDLSGFNHAWSQGSQPAGQPGDLGYRDLLQHLLQYWTAPPHRVFRRFRKNGVVALCSNLSAIHYFLLLDRDAGISCPQDGFRCTHWLLLNESADGIALSRPRQAGESMDRGELLALRNEPGGHWRLAIARRVSIGENGELEVGAQMIAPRVQAVWLHMPDQAGSLPALLLPEQATLRQPATLIASAGTFVPGRIVQLDEAGSSVDVVLKNLVEHTPLFERFGFDRIS